MGKLHKSGFTLIETLIALMLLSVALAPTIFAATSSTKTAFSIKNNVTAANLAQEGIEVIRAIRDSNWFQDLAFDTSLAAGDYEVESDSVPPLSTYQDRFLNFGSYGKYRYGAINATPFKRKITITKVSLVELMITSEVTWLENSRTRSVKLESHLFDWR